MTTTPLISVDDGLNIMRNAAKVTQVYQPPK
jgi:hypothetical protein